MQKLPLAPVGAITFDMYGTPLDLVASFAAGFEEFLQSKATREARKMLSRCGKWPTYKKVTRIHSWDALGLHLRLSVD